MTMITVSNKFKGHTAAIFTILVWGSTFVSTKILLADFEPVEIIFLRFLVGFAFLWIIAPRSLGRIGWKNEAVFALAGLCGVTLNYLLETFALQYTNASNLAVIVSITPLVTGIAAAAIFKKRLKLGFIIGFFLSFIGIFLISFSSGEEFDFHLRGDMLGLAVAVVWTVYTFAAEKLSKNGYDIILMTRRIFFYGIVFMIPFEICFRTVPNFELWARPQSLGLLLYLGIVACSLSYMTWNYAVGVLGSVPSNLYFYVSPIVTVIFSVLILHETLSLRVVLGMVFTLLGIAISGELIGNIKEIISKKHEQRNITQ